MLILLVDDEPDFLEVMGARISGWGYNSIMVSNGKDALLALKDKKPDIIILDYMMPDMDGVSTLKEIRKTDSNIPVIMFTAHPDVEAMKEIQKLGVTAFIPKLSVYFDAQSALKSAIDMLDKRLKKEG